MKSSPSNGRGTPRGGMGAHFNPGIDTVNNDTTKTNNWTGTPGGSSSNLKHGKIANTPSNNCLKEHIHKNNKLQFYAVPKAMGGKGPIKSSIHIGTREITSGFTSHPVFATGYRQSGSYHGKSHDINPGAVSHPVKPSTIIKSTNSYTVKEENHNTSLWSRLDSYANKSGLTTYEKKVVIPVNSRYELVSEEKILS
jgi:hypothetical protein